MFNDIGERFKQIRKHYNLTQQLFSISLGISRSHISNIENGREKPSDTLLMLLNSKYHINTEWLLEGKGNMLINDIDVVTSEEFERKEYISNLYNKLFKATNSHVKRHLYNHILECLLTILVEDSYWLVADIDSKERLDYLKYTDELFTKLSDLINEIRIISKNSKQNDYKQMLEAKNTFDEAIADIKNSLSDMCSSLFIQNNIKFKL